MSRMMQIFLAVLWITALCVAQQPPLLMVAGQQQFVTAPASCGALNAFSSSDPLTVSVQQLNQTMYRFEAVKAGSATITRNCQGSVSFSTLTVQSGEYKTLVCPPRIESTYIAPQGWAVEQKQRRDFSLLRATLDAKTGILTCHYGDDDVLLTRIMQGRCELSPNARGAYCAP